MTVVTSLRQQKMLNIIFKTLAAALFVQSATIGQKRHRDADDNDELHEAQRQHYDDSSEANSVGYIARYLNLTEKMNWRMASKQHS